MRIHGQTAGTTAKVLVNRMAYGAIRAVTKQPPEGWLYSRWHWYRYPFDLRGHVMWSAPLKAWFHPEEDSAIECMLHMPSYEPVDWVSPGPGDVFVDVGAYIGWYAIQAARMVGQTGRVIALEPDASNRRQLEANLSLNGISNCTVVPLAAWSSAKGVGWHSDEVPVWRRVDHLHATTSVPTVTIDALVTELCLRDVQWIKMDIEGAETEALRGAEEILRRYHPVLFIEIHETLGVVRAFLEGLGYTIEKSAFDQPPDRHGWILARHP